jgi:hypothetical protein
VYTNPNKFTKYLLKMHSLLLETQRPSAQLSGFCSKSSSFLGESYIIVNCGTVLDLYEVGKGESGEEMLNKTHSFAFFDRICDFSVISMQDRQYILVFYPSHRAAVVFVDSNGTMQTFQIFDLRDESLFVEPKDIFSMIGVRLRFPSSFSSSRCLLWNQIPRRVQILTAAVLLAFPMALS